MSVDGEVEGKRHLRIDLMQIVVGSIISTKVFGLQEPDWMMNKTVLSEPTCSKSADQWAGISFSVKL